MFKFIKNIRNIRKNQLSNLNIDFQSENIVTVTKKLCPVVLLMQK